MFIRFAPLVLASFAGACLARDCCCFTDEKDPVKVTLVVILASDKGDKIDPRLKAIAEEVRKKEPTLTNFTMKSMRSNSFKPGEKFSMPMLDEKKVEMLIKHGADKQNCISLSLFPPSMGEIEYKTVCGKFLPVVTPCKTKNNERIILAIRVQPCKGE